MIIKSQAIQTALMGNWDRAVFLNLELLKENPNDIDTLNRLAFAFSVLGKIKNARDTYQKVLTIDYQNPIAKKGLKRLIGSDKNSLNKLKGPLLSQVDTMFIEESGKTKIVELVNIATPKTITSLMAGEALTLRVKRLKIFVLDQRCQYIGVLPDDIGRRLIRFIKGGNSYEAYTKLVEDHRVIIFIKETKRSSRFKNQPSFLSGIKSHLTIEKSSVEHEKNNKNKDKTKNYEEEDLEEE